MSARAIGTNGNALNHPDRWSDHNEKVPVVYFDLVLLSEAIGPPRIKIGESGNHKKRIAAHAKSKFGITFDVQHLCMVRGTKADEQQVLKYFVRHKLEDEEETFWPNEELVDYIRWLRDQYFVWVPDCNQCPPIHHLDMVEASCWMPSPERRKPGPPLRNLFDDFGKLNLPPREITIDDFYTSEIIIEAARKAIGAIDLDPASHPIANCVVKAARFFSIHDDGLSKQWHGGVWLNPPFSQWQTWVPKIITEWKSGRVTAICLLAATRTLTARYFADIHKTCSAVCVLHGRIPFWGGRAASPDDGHAIFYLGNEPERFAGAFAELGSIYFSRITPVCTVAD